MAGLGRKTWTNEVLSQPDLQGYLQDQVVMVFANAAARAAAIPAPTEGMHSYQLDTHRPEFYNGTAWLPTQYGQVRGKMWRNAGFSGFLTTSTTYTVPMQASRVSGGFTFGGGDNLAGASSYLVVPYDGLYDVHYGGYLSGGATSVFGQLVTRHRTSVADATIAASQAYKASASIDHIEDFYAAGLPLKAGDQIFEQFLTYTNSGGNLSFYGNGEVNGCHLTITYAGPLAGATAL